MLRLAGVSASPRPLVISGRMLPQPPVPVLVNVPVPVRLNQPSTVNDVAWRPYALPKVTDAVEPLNRSDCAVWASTADGAPIARATSALHTRRETHRAVWERWNVMVSALGGRWDSAWPGGLDGHRVISGGPPSGPKPSSSLRCAPGSAIAPGRDPSAGSRWRSAHPT